MKNRLIGLPARIQRLSDRQLLFLILTAAFIVALPSVFTGRFWDDYDHYNRYYKFESSVADAFRAYEFLPRQEDLSVIEPLLPWFATPHVHVTFFRPLAGVLIYLDYRLFGDAPVLHHLHNLFWYLAWLLAAGALLRQLLPGRVWLLALLFVALHPISSWNASVLLARYSIVCTALAMAGAAAHIRWRQANWWPGLPLSIIGYITGLLTGEVAVAALGFVGAFEVVRYFRTGRQPGAMALPRLRSAALGLAPAMIVATTYVGFYVYSKLGVPDSMVYLNPFAMPGEFLAAMGARILFAFGSYAATPEYGLLMALDYTSHHIYGDWIRRGYIAAGVVTLAGILAAMAYTFPRLDTEARDGLGTLLLGGLIGLVPMTTMYPSGRIVMTPSIAVTALLVLAAATWLAASPPARRERRRRALRCIAAMTLAVFVLSWQVQIQMMGFTFRAQRDYAVHAPFPPDIHERDVIVLRTGVGVYNVDHVRTAYDRSNPRSWVILADTARNLEVIVQSPHRLEMRAAGGALLEGFFSEFFGVPGRAFAPGDRFSRAHVDVEVLETFEGIPSAAAFDFHQPLDHEDLVWVVDHGRALHRVQMPPQGQTTDLDSLVANAPAE